MVTLARAAAFASASQVYKKQEADEHGHRVNMQLHVTWRESQLRTAIFFKFLAQRATSSAAFSGNSVGPAPFGKT